MSLSHRFSLDPDVVFLNHGSFGATPTALLERQSEFRAQMESDPVRFFGRMLPSLLAQVRAELADYIGASDPEGVALVPNATTAINVAARSVELRAGDEIVLSDHEYGAMRLLWDEVAAQSGARVVVVKLPMPYTQPSEVFAEFADAVTDRTRVVFFSHITSLSAYVLPAVELAALAREVGATCIIDGAHAPGQIGFDVDEIGADCYAGNGHKWLCCPKGTGFLHVRADARQWMRGDVVSWGWRWNGSDAFQGRFNWPGTTDPTALLCIPEAIALQQSEEWRSETARAVGLAREASARLRDRFGATQLARDEVRAPQMVPLSFPEPNGVHPEEIQEALWDRHKIEMPVELFHGLTLGRLSVQVYTDYDDVQALVTALEQEFSGPSG